MSPAAFVAAVDNSFLPKKEKADLRRLAESGLDEGGWRELNRRLIEELLRRESLQHRFTRDIDDEINTFTARYEREKSVMDRDFRKTLEGADEGDKERLWEDYRGKIRLLQAKILKEMQKESTTLLHDVALMTDATP